MDFPFLAFLLLLLLLQQTVSSLTQNAHLDPPHPASCSPARKRNCHRWKSKLVRLRFLITFFRFEKSHQLSAKEGLIFHDVLMHSYYDDNCQDYAGTEYPSPTEVSDPLTQVVVGLLARIRLFGSTGS